MKKKNKTAHRRTWTVEKLKDVPQIRGVSFNRDFVSHWRHADREDDLEELMYVNGFQRYARRRIEVHKA